MILKFRGWVRERTRQIMRQKSNKVGTGLGVENSPTKKNK